MELLLMTLDKKDNEYRMTQGSYVLLRNEMQAALHDTCRKTGP